MSPALQTTSTTRSQSTTSSHSGDALSPTSSPPFVLSFLAIGLFSSAMIFIFWRRMHVNRTWRSTIINMSINRSYVELPIHHEDIPKLWDVKSGGNFARGQEKEGMGVGPESDVKWINVMPLSLSTREELNPPTADYRISNLNTLLWQNRNQSPSRHGVKTPSDDGVKAMIQVAVAIALPSPQGPIHIKNRNIDQHEMEKDTDREKMTDYCIGMYECPWRK